MRRVWIWLLAGGLALLGVVGCSQVESSSVPEATFVTRSDTSTDRAGKENTPLGVPTPKTTNASASGEMLRETLPPRISPVTGLKKDVLSETPIQDHPGAFLIYGLKTPSSGTPGGSRSPEGYADDVIKAATVELSARLDVPAASIDVVFSGYLEVQHVSPCGTAVKDGVSAADGGLALGYEVVLGVGDVQHRYVALGGLAYYCGAQ